MGNRRRLLAAVALLAVLPATGVAWRQNAPASVRAWIGHEAAMEAHLRTAEVTRLEEIGTGVTRPRRAYLSPAEPFDSLTWKVIPPGRHNGYWDSYKSEIAAYLLDRRLDLRMVPPAVERSIRGETGAAVMWVGGVKSVKQTGGQVPSGEVWGGAIRRMQMFDNFIGNGDRNAGNILLGEPGEIVLIDHSRAFVPDRKLPFKFERVDAGLWDRLTALTRDDLEQTIGPWVEAHAIDAMLERRKHMMKDVDTLVKKHGRALVIIP
jgi:hypothetical protein